MSENRRLRDILKANGITVDDLIRMASRPPSPTRTNTSIQGYDDFSMQGDFSPSPSAGGYMSSGYSQDGTPDRQHQSQHQQQLGYGMDDGLNFGTGGVGSTIYGGTTGQQGINYSQIGIDFVLAYVLHLALPLHSPKIPNLHQPLLSLKPNNHFNTQPSPTIKVKPDQNYS